MYIQLYPHTQH